MFQHNPMDLPDEIKRHLVTQAGNDEDQSKMQKTRPPKTPGSVLDPMDFLQRDASGHFTNVLEIDASE